MTDLIDLDGLNSPMDSVYDDILTTLMAATPGAAGLAANALVANNIPWVKDRPWARGATHAVLATAEGILIAKYLNKTVGAGVAFAGTALGILQVVGDFVPAVQAPLNETLSSGAVAGLDASLDDEDLLLGLGLSERDSVLAGGDLGAPVTRRLNDVAGGSVRENTRSAVGVGAIR